jgi:hypothetical protein
MYGAISEAHCTVRESMKYRDYWQFHTAQCASLIAALLFMFVDRYIKFCQQRFCEGIIQIYP